jgi:hypothetical protein
MVASAYRCCSGPSTLLVPISIYDLAHPATMRGARTVGKRKMSDPSQPKHTGLICEACNQPVVFIEYQTPSTLTMWCPIYGHR